MTDEKRTPTRPYDDIPRTGSHPETGAEYVSDMNVRAPQPDDLKPRSRRSPRTYQLVFDRSLGCHQVRSSDQQAEGDQCDILGRFETGGDLLAALADVPDKPLHVVFEDLSGGDIFADEVSHLSDNWLGEGNFDRVTFFSTAERAEQYVADRQKETGSSGS
jgi:hypothetical protein